VIGTIVVPLIILLVSYGKFLFGWAKPVPVNYSALRKPRQHMAWVAAAGPGANLLMALIWALVLRSRKLTSRTNGWSAQQYGVSGLVDAVMRHTTGLPSSDRVALPDSRSLLLMLLNLLPSCARRGRIVAGLLPSRAAGGSQARAIRPAAALRCSSCPSTAQMRQPDLSPLLLSRKRWCAIVL
jgi:hypothetical protein